jgi:hypothetical protein
MYLYLWMGQAPRFVWTRRREPERTVKMYSGQNPKQAGTSKDSGLPGALFFKHKVHCWSLIQRKSETKRPVSSRFGSHEALFDDNKMAPWRGTEPGAVFPGEN